jgi:peptide/nickel transport system permease protein
VRFLLRRLAHALLLVCGVSLLSFLFVEMAPGDFFDEMRLDPRVSPATVEALRARYGIDRPLPERYGHWLASTLRGEMGYSFAYGRPVGELVWGRAARTLGLTATATLVAWLLALPLGAFLASRAGRLADRVGATATSALLAIPDLALALLLLLVAVRTGVFPAGGMTSTGFDELSPLRQLADVVWHAALPVLALALGSLAVLVRHVRAALVESLRAPHVRAARGHGIPETRLLLRHALPAAAAPLLSLLGLSIGGLLSSSILVEVVMGWPGLGPLLLDAILSRDVHLVAGPVVLSTLFLVAGNLLADTLIYWSDPRIRTGGGR